MANATDMMSGRNTAEMASFVRGNTLEQQPPPVLVGGPIAWMRDKLFASVGDTLMTLAGLYLVYLIIPPLVQFLFINAVWTGADRDACLSDKVGFEVGACWAFVADRLAYFTYGSYTLSERWRVDIVFLLGAIGIAWMLWLDAPRRDLGAAYFFLLFPVVSFILLVGGHYDFQNFLLGGARNAVSFGRSESLIADILGWGLSVILLPFALLGSVVGAIASPIKAATGLSPFWLDYVASAGLIAFAAILVGRAFGQGARESALPVLIGFGVFGLLLVLLEIDWGLAYVPTNLWGGILVTMVVASVGIVFSLPLGVLLALGRRSRMPVVRMLSVIFIEFVRGVPLITVLFMANTMLPLFLPGNLAPDRLLRPLVGVAIFASAYMAEVVRGGLQAIPKGQYEGAMSLGLGYWTMMRLIILPQAIKIVIPGIVNTFIGLFKDTTLVYIVGIFDFLRTIDASLVDPTWATPTSRYTGYAFAAIFYFICCYGMSRYSLAIERRMAKGQKR